MVFRAMSADKITKGEKGVARTETGVQGWAIFSAVVTSGHQPGRQRGDQTAGRNWPV